MKSHSEKKLSITAMFLGFFVVAAVLFGILQSNRLRAERKIADEAQALAGLEQGHDWMFRARQADLQGRQYPDTLLYALKAIGFAGHGFEAAQGEKRTATPANPGPVCYLHEANAPDAFAAARDWIAKRPSYRPVWASGPGDAVVGLIAGQGFLAAAMETQSRRWDFSGDADPGVVNLPGAAALAAHPDGSAFALAGQRKIEVWRNGAPAESHDLAARALAFSIMGDTLAAADSDNSIHLFGKEVRKLSQAPGLVKHLAFGPEDAILAAAIPGTGVRMYFFRDGLEHPLWRDNTDSVTALAFHPDPQSGLVAVGTASGEILIRRVADGTLAGRVGPDGPVTGPVNGLWYQPDGKRLASCGDDRAVKLWETISETPLLLARLNGHRAPVKAVAFLPGGGYLASADAGGRVLIWAAAPDTKAANWFDYIQSGWYSFEPLSHELTVGESNGFVNKGESDLGLNWKRSSSVFSSVHSFVHGTTPKNEFVNTVGMKMIWCPPGKFVMGEADGPVFARQHPVELTRGFWLGQTEVTQLVYEAVTGKNASANPRGRNYPVENLTWEEAAAFCVKLTVRERLKGTIPGGVAYALPTEAQWEYACRAGTTTRWSFGDNPAEMDSFAHCNGETTQPAGQLKPNPWGFFDMHGNVFEWCRDAMDTKQPDYPEGPVTDPFSTQGSLRIVRGGDYGALPAECACGYRDANAPLQPSPAAGFRVALVPLSEVGDSH